MTTQRQPTGRPTAITSLSPGSSHTCTEISPTDPTILLEDAPLYQPEDEEASRALQLEATRQSWFQKQANDNLNRPNGYLKVAVLMIRWDDEVDNYKQGHEQEINILRGLFEDRFHYECEIVKLSACGAQIDLNVAILQHIQKHNGPDNLLVIYYTGHGRIDGSRLELTGGRSSEQNLDPIAYWDAAEAPLKELTTADVLSILDCCFASSAASKGRAKDTRRYQLMAASTAKGFTPEPGSNSFTTALIESLEELLDDNADQNYSITKLGENINRRRPNHASPIWDRLKKYGPDINLAPLLKPYHEREGSFLHGGPEKASLLLRFSLKKDYLEKEQIEALANHLPEAFKKSNVPVRQIDWVKMETTIPTPVSFRGAVTVGVAGTRLRRRSSARKKQQLDTSPKSPTAARRKRSLSNVGLLSPSKRRSPSSDRMLRSETCSPVSPRSSGRIDEETPYIGGGSRR